MFQFLPQKTTNEQVPRGGHIPVNHPVMMDGKITVSFLNIIQVMATQPQVVTAQD